MNRNYKVIWNASLNCFMAVAEYAKSRGKSSSSAVTSSATVTSGSVVASGVNILRWSAVCMGLIAAGFSMQATALCATGDAIDCGAGAAATGSSSIALGQNAKATAGQSIAIGGAAGGQFTTASGDQSIALGANVVSSGSSSIAIGGDDLNQASRTNVDADGNVTSTGTNNNSGNVNTAFRKYSGRDLVGTPQFPNTAASGQASVAIGVQSVSSGALSTAFGTQTKASGIASAAFGVSANASKEGSVALGAGSQTDGSATKVTKQTVNGVEFTGFVGNSSFAGTAADAGRQVSVGLIGNERQIKNVAPGELSATSTDAINGSQIYAVSSKLIDNINAVKTTTDAVVAGTAGLVKQANGTAPITVGGTTAGTSVSFANSTGGNRVLSGVADGEVVATSKEAVNGGQLYSTNQNVTTAQNTANTANTTANTANTTANSALGKANLGIKVGNGTTNNQFALGETINVKGDDNLTSTTTADGVQVSLNKTLDLGATGSVTTGASKLSNTGITITKAATSPVGITDITLTNAGLNNGGNKIINVAAGTLSDTSTDAVNGSQLNATNTKVTTNTTNIATNTSNIAGLSNGTAGIVRQNASTGAITVGGTTAGTSVSFAGTAGNRVLSGVADGEVVATSKEAVNGGQLYSTNQNVTTAQNTANTANTTANTANTTANSALGKANLGIKVGNGTTNNQFALGETINVKGDDNLTSTTTADGVQVSLNKTLDLGATGSVTTGASKLSNTGITITKAATSPVGITDITLTNAGLNNGGNKIINVAAGTLSDTSTDAVNGSQLNATNTKVTTNTTNIATNTSNIAGLTNGTAGLVKQANGTAPITVGGTTAGTSVSFANSTGGNRVLSGVADGIAPTDAANVSQLKTSSVVAGNNTTVSDVTTGSNTQYTVNAAKSTVSAATDSGLAVQTGTTVNDVTDYAVELDAASKASLGKADSAVQTITSGNDNLTASKTGNDVVIGFVDAPTFTGQVKANGFDANSQKIVNVANGATTSGSKDAINGGQLNTTAGSIATNLGGGATYDATTGTVTAPTYTFANGTATPDTFNNVGDALGNLDTRTTTNTTNIAANAGNIIKSKTTVTSGKNVEVTADTNDDGSANYIIKTKDDLVLTSVQTGDSLLDTNGLTITGGPSVTKTGLNAGNKKITGVLAGEDATDAVNKSQLDAITGNITAGGVQYDRNTDNTVNYDRVSFAGASTIIGKDKNNNNIVVRGGTTLTNIANGINAADAVNKGQLDNVTKVKIFDKNGDEITVNIADQIVNNNVNNEDLDSLFLTYNVRGQGVTDRLTIGETVQKMNTEGVKFSHTNGVAPPVGDALTNDSSAGGDNSTAIGVNAIITRNGESSIALGHNTRVEGASSVAIGNGSQANGNQSIAIGTGNIVNGDNSGAFGDPNIIDGSSSYSVGNNNNIDSDDTFVLGNNVIQTVAGSVVLGSESGTTTKGGIIGYLANINDINDLILATRSNRGAVAVGNAEAGIYRQITGVAAGTADSDAVNVSQLKAVNAKIDNIGGSNTTLNDAAVQYDKKDGNINKGNITLAGTSVSTGTGNNGNTVVTSGGTTITNVANGLNVSDAVNKGQLDSLGGGVAGIIGGGAKYENGKLVAGSNGIGNTGESTIHDAIASINNGNAQANESIKANTDSIKTNANNIKANNDSIKANTDDIKANTNRLNSGLSFGADSGNDINKSVGDSTALKFEGGNNITTTATGNGIKFDLNGNISVDSVTTGNTTINNKGVIIKDGPSMTVDGIYAGDKTITGVADGIEVKDAVNFGQLNALDKRLGNSINELGYKINEVEDDANAGISAAMAMSSLPQAYIPGKSMVGGGIATYNGQSAVAVGVSKVSDNGRWVIKANGTADTQGNAGGAIGAGFHF